jgi:hypothetical protein
MSQGDRQVASSLFGDWLELSSVNTLYRHLPDVVLIVVPVVVVGVVAVVVVVDAVLAGVVVDVVGPV